MQNSVKVSKEKRIDRTHPKPNKSDSGIDGFKLFLLGIAGLGCYLFGSYHPIQGVLHRISQIGIEGTFDIGFDGIKFELTD